MILSSYLIYLVLVIAKVLFLLPACGDHVTGSDGQLAFEILPVDSFKRGQSQLKELESWSGTAACWSDALAQFQQGCKQLSSVDQSRLAITLTNCHLARSGHKTFPCLKQQTIEECTRPMDKADFIIYTEFFTNAISICFFIRNQRWQEDTEIIINQLSRSSMETADNLKQSLKYHQLVLRQQNNSLTNQKLILENERILKDSLKNSTENVVNTLDKANFVAQRNFDLIKQAFGTVIDHMQYVTSIQVLLLGEFSSFYTVIYYVCGIILAYLLTGTDSTRRARIWIFIALSVNMIIERLVLNVIHNYMLIDGKTKSSIYSVTWMCRRMFIFICGTILTVAFMKYRDYSKINNVLLEKIANQNTELKALLTEKSHQTKVGKKTVIDLTKEEFSDIDTLHTRKEGHLRKGKDIQGIGNINRELTHTLSDSGISDDSDVEIQAIISPAPAITTNKTKTYKTAKTPPNRVGKKENPNLVTPERNIRSPTCYNLRQQFGYRPVSVKEVNSKVEQVRRSSSSTSNKKRLANKVDLIPDMASVKLELFSDED